MLWALLFFSSCGNPPAKKLLEEKKERNTVPVVLKKESKRKETSMNEKISEELEHAHSKTDCMIEYLKKKDTEQIDISYEEYCR